MTTPCAYESQESDYDDRATPQTITTTSKMIAIVFQKLEKIPCKRERN